MSALVWGTVAAIAAAISGAVLWSAWTTEQRRRADEAAWQRTVARLERERWDHRRGAPVLRPMGVPTVGRERRN